MSKVTSKYQVSIPKGPKTAFSVRERLRLFDAATARQAERERVSRLLRAKGKGRGWTREDLSTR